MRRDRATVPPWRNRYVVLLSIGCCLLGCGGPQLGYVEGTVRMDGQPVKDATVIFQPDDGLPSHGETDSQGHYELKFSDKLGAVVGGHTVTVETYRISTDASGEPVESREMIPAKYNSETELSREVVAGKQTIDFDLTSN